MSAPERDRKALRDFIADAPRTLGTITGAVGILHLMAERLRAKDRHVLLGGEHRDHLPPVSANELELVADALAQEENRLNEDIYGVAEEEGITPPPELDRDYARALRGMRAERGGAP